MVQREGKEMQDTKVLIQMRDLRVGNGIAACIMNYYEYTVQHGYSIDFLLNRNIDSPYVELVKKHGGNIYVLPCDTGKPNKKNMEYIKNIVTNQYDIFHVNLSGLNALQGLEAARTVGIKRRIYHAHNPKETSSLKARVRSAVYEVPSVKIANQYAACSHHAGSSLFGKKNYTVIKNAMDTKRFDYDIQAREKLRSEMGISDSYVVGVVGRLAEQKNPYFELDIFAELIKLKNNAILIWAGDGALRDELEKYAEKKGVFNSVKFLGSRMDVNKLYSAMDVLLLPSKFEGLGLVFIEAQISGLTCFGSDQVPEDVEISPNMHRMSLKKSATEWAKAIVIEEKNDRADCRKYAVEAGFEIHDTLDSLTNLYAKSR